jgi:hypothetical protein
LLQLLPWPLRVSPLQSSTRESSSVQALRLSALMDFYIHPLKEIFHPSHHKIYSFPASIRPLYHSLSTMGPTCHFV